MSITALLIAAAGGLIAIIAAFMKGRVDGAKIERASTLAKEAKARDIADEVENDVGVMTPEQVKAELEKWSKD